jgi:hypothetical protein
LATARTINGVAFDGSANITINATDPSGTSFRRVVSGTSASSISYTFPSTGLGEYLVIGGARQSSVSNTAPFAMAYVNRNGSSLAIQTISSTNGGNFSASGNVLTFGPGPHTVSMVIIVLIE